MTSWQPPFTPFYVYVDFDSTLFDTPRFATDLWAMIHDWTGVSVEQIRAETANFQFHASADIPQLHSYDFEQHIAHYGLLSTDLWSALDTLLTTTNYLYEDSVSFIASLQAADLRPEILSFGEPRFQTAKINAVFSSQAAPSLPTVPFTVVTQRKRDYIAETNPGQRGVLVDDIPNQDLPAGFIEIELDRQRKLRGPAAKDRGYIVTDLTQARQAIDQLASS